MYKTLHWEFHENNQEVVYPDGTRERLPARLNRCLAVLLKAEGQTVTYEQLLEEVWGTQFRDPNTISAVISELRKLIDNKQDKTKYIITVPKKGYRFQYNLVIDDQPPNTVLSSNEPVIAEKLNHQHSQTLVDSKWVKIIATSLFLLIFLLIIWQFHKVEVDRSQNLNKSFFNANSTKVLTYENGLEMEFDVSHDDRWLAYVHETKDERLILLKNLETGMRYALVPEAGQIYTSPAFSPDGGSLIYRLQKESLCSVWQVNLTQHGFDLNSKKKITNCGSGDTWSTLSFDKEGKSIFFAKSLGVHEPFNIVIHHLKTGFERNITTPSTTGRGDYAFSLSPDGKKLAIIRNELWQNSHLLMLTLESGELTKLENVPSLLFSVTWDNNHHILYASRENKITRLNIDNLKKEVIPIDLDVNMLLMKKDKLYFLRGRRLVSKVWQINLRDAELIERLNSEYLDTYPLLDNQGDLIFKSDRSGHIGIWRVKNNKQIEILHDNFIRDLKKIVLSGDNLFGLYHKRVVKVDINTGEFQWLTPNDKKIINFSISKDKKFITFSRELNETWHVERLSLLNNDSQWLDFEGFTVKDTGSDIYFTRFRQTGLWRYNLATKKVDLVKRNFSVFSADDWDVVDNYIVSIRKNFLTIYDLTTNSIINHKNLGKPIGSIYCNNKLVSCIFNVFNKGRTEIVRVNKS